MKVAANQLFSLIREIVSAEIKKTLPGLVREVLAESYIRQVVSESVQPAPALPVSVQRVIPRGSPKTVEKSQLREMIRAQVVDEADEIEQPAQNNPLLDPSNPMNFIYEDVQIPKDKVELGKPSISLEAFNFDPEKMRSLISAPAPRTEVRGDASFEERRLAKLRKDLDVKVKS